MFAMSSDDICCQISDIATMYNQSINVACFISTFYNPIPGTYSLCGGLHVRHVEIVVGRQLHAVTW